MRFLRGDGREMATRPGAWFGLVSQFREIRPHRRFRATKSLRLDVAGQLRSVMLARLPLFLQVGEIGRQLATTITARTSFGKLLGLGEFGHRLFIQAQHAGNRSKTPALRMELAHFLIACQAPVTARLVDALGMGDDDGLRRRLHIVLFSLLLLSLERALDRLVMAGQDLFECCPEIAK
jgi:hypothetical protein